MTWLALLRSLRGRGIALGLACALASPPPSRKQTVLG